MKFLTISRAREAMLMLPPSVLRPLMEASYASMIQLKKEGKILEYYQVPGNIATVVLSENSTAEELQENIGKTPLTSYMTMEVYPLANFDEAMKGMIENLKKSEQTMPGAPK